MIITDGIKAPDPDFIKAQTRECRGRRIFGGATLDQRSIRRLNGKKRSGDVCLLIGSSGQRRYHVCQKTAKWEMDMDIELLPALCCKTQRHESNDMHPSSPW